MVSSVDNDPQNRWDAIYVFYEDVSDGSWKPRDAMLSFVAGASQTALAERVYPSTSHYHLCVHGKPGYHLDSPFFSVMVDEFGQVEFEMWRKVGSLSGRTKCKAAEALAVFNQLCEGLLSMTDIP